MFGVFFPQATGKSDKCGDMTRKDGNKMPEPSGRAHAPKAFPSAGTDNRGAKGITCTFTYKVYMHVVNLKRMCDFLEQLGEEKQVN